MQIKQFEDKSLAHFSYAILSECEKKIVLIDPSRDPDAYLAFAKDNDAEITGIIETHPHADFISSHLELHQTTGATIYTSKLVGATYPHKNFDKVSPVKTAFCTLLCSSTIQILSGEWPGVFMADNFILPICK